MEIEKLIEQAKRILSNAPKVNSRITMAEALELFRNYAGASSSFYKLIENKSTRINPNLGVYRELATDTLQAFINYLESGLFQGVSIERKAQAEVVSDFLEQSNSLLEDIKVHPASPAVIIGAALEEYLRNWIESKKIDVKGKKPGINIYATSLRDRGYITKQDITACGLNYIIMLLTENRSMSQAEKRLV